jgi:signal transduction histidine kinase
VRKKEAMTDATNETINTQDQPTQSFPVEYEKNIRRITHDFNNMLSGVLGYAELAMLSLDNNAEAQESIQECINAALRAKTLVLEMIELNRKNFGYR